MHNSALKLAVIAEQTENGPISAECLPSARSHSGDNSPGHDFVADAAHENGMWEMLQLFSQCPWASASLKGHLRHTGCLERRSASAEANTCDASEPQGMLLAGLQTPPDRA